MLSRLMILIYGILCYVVGLASLLYMVGWLGNIAVPRSIDAPAAGPLGAAIGINALVFVIFCVQHSVMARPRFKAWWTKIVPPSAERSTYVLASGFALFLVMLCWQPMGAAIWDIRHPYARIAVHAIYGLGWVTLVGSTFALNHFDLFGLRTSLATFPRQVEYTDRLCHTGTLSDRTASDLCRLVDSRVVNSHNVLGSLRLRVHDDRIHPVGNRLGGKGSCRSTRRDLPIVSTSDPQTCTERVTCADAKLGRDAGRLVGAVQRVSLRAAESHDRAIR